MSTTTTEVRLQPEVWELVDATAAEQGQSVTAYIDGTLRRLPPTAAAVDLLKSVDVAGLVRKVAIDQALFDPLLDQAARVGGTPAAIIADAVRRDVAARLLRPVLAEIDASGPDLDPDAADDLVYSESRAARRSRRR